MQDKAKKEEKATGKMDEKEKKMGELSAKKEVNKPDKKNRKDKVHFLKYKSQDMNGARWAHHLSFWVQWPFFFIVFFKTVLDRESNIQRKFQKLFRVD